MKVANMVLRTRYGWPVTSIIGHPVVSIIRAIIHTDIVQTIKHRGERA